ncbi:Ger(x)C family spore germination protein [Halobacillus locisalis]|uniref:Ger(X)C family spore germination protein n=1 Tax=Halobacillus locisalis TaxID=220753 RepID=A0A838CVC7_9BACI|nr:Ger(x)C family spore germination protein [Halobacillus locisalis]MBA2175894.1 Ger(x)C family spore germination protein [Halobacillus locisalis]
MSKHIGWCVPFLLIIMTGCIPTYGVEDNAIIQTAGYDPGEENEIQGTVAIPKFIGGEEKSAIEEQYVTVSASSIKSVEDQVQNRISQPVSIGKLNVTLFNEELAEKDLGQFIDVLSRDPRLSRNMFLAVTKGNTKSIIEGGHKKGETISDQLTGLIQNNMNNDFPSTDMHDFLSSYFAFGKDSFLPYLKLEEDKIVLEEIALFDKSKMVATLSKNEMFVFRILKENFNQAMETLNFKEGTVVLENIGNRVQYRVDHRDALPSFTIQLDLKAVINEIRGIEHTVDKKLITEMESDFETYYQTKATEVISLFQEKGIDPLGLGQFYRSRTRNFKENEWDALYKNIPISVQVSVSINEFGITT